MEESCGKLPLDLYLWSLIYSNSYLFKSIFGRFDALFVVFFRSKD